MLIALQKNKAIFYTNLIGCICSIVVYSSAAYVFGFYGVAIGRILLYIVLSSLGGYFIYRELKRLQANDN